MEFLLLVWIWSRCRCCIPWISRWKSSLCLFLSHLLFSLPPVTSLSLSVIQVHKFAKKGGMKQRKESKPAKKESLPPPQVLHMLCCLVAWRQLSSVPQSLWSVQTWLSRRNSCVNLHLYPISLRLFQTPCCNLHYLCGSTPKEWRQKQAEDKLISFRSR